MRKWLYLSLLCALCACTRNITLVPQSVTMYAGDSVRVTVRDEVVAAGYFTLNEFVAKANRKNGWVIACHVGETQVVYGRERGDYDVYYGSCTINVQPRYTYYVEPLEGFVTPQEVVDSLGQPDSVVRDSLCYAYVYGDVGSVWAPKDDYETRYVFDNYDTFKYAVVTGQFGGIGLSSEQLQAFLAERYRKNGEREWVRRFRMVRVYDERDVDGALTIRYTPFCDLPD